VTFLLAAAILWPGYARMVESVAHRP
jgi:hypothetical protein